MSEEKKVELGSEQLEQVAGGYNNYGKTCPNCGSEKINFRYDHDEIGVFHCDNCGREVQIGF